MSRTRSIRVKARQMRAWPLLALLLLVVLVGTGCVLWFMVEAARSERLAVRQRFADAYRGHLELVQARLAEAWKRQGFALEQGATGSAGFVRVVREDLAESAICLDQEGHVIYPHPVAAAGDRDPEVNAELFALESLKNRSSPEFREAAEQLLKSVNTYGDILMPSAQRRFVMRELARLLPDASMPTADAEELAARFLEGAPEFPLSAVLAQSGLSQVWHMASPNRRMVALFTTRGLKERLQAMVSREGLPAGVTVATVAPGSEPSGDQAALLLTAAAGNAFPGWRLALSLDDRTVFQTAADRRVTRYLWTGALVVFVMLALAAFIAIAFSRQVRLAQLKNDLVATVSHELKTPLTAIRALVDTLLEAERIDEPTAREYLQLIAQENSRLSRLIDNFLTFARLDRNRYAFRYRAVAPESIVEQTITAAGERCRAPGCQLEVRTAPQLPKINGDLDALVTALLNLLDNALKYSGEIKHIVLETTAPDGVVRFAVGDNGVGLSASETRKVFREFYRTDQRLSGNAQGCGLGLSIVQHIVTAHGGTVSVASEPQRGSTFTIEIPAAGITEKV